jgi:hypothetical protein
MPLEYAVRRIHARADCVSLARSPKKASCQLVICILNAAYMTHPYPSMAFIALYFPAPLTAVCRKDYSGFVMITKVFYYIMFVSVAALM